MKLELEPPKLAYKSVPQIVRETTERWALENFYCVSCGSSLESYSTNTPVYDFHSPECHEKFQLKASKKPFGIKVLDSEYNKALNSIMKNEFPSLILLHYDSSMWKVRDLGVIHRACITPSCIIPRKPLTSKAERAGWQGCLISLSEIPALGRIDVVKNGIEVPQSSVLKKWKDGGRLLKVEPQLRGWLADVLKCVERLFPVFTLEDVYSFEVELAAKHPNNRNIKAKIRQQLQMLRDIGFIEFVDRGLYRRTTTNV